MNIKKKFSNKKNMQYIVIIGYFNPPVVVDIGKSIQYIV